MKRFFREGSSSRHVLTLMTGTAIAQAIPMAISPILTRLYTPKDLGLLALFMALSAIPSAVASGRYELAIQLAKDDDEAINVAALSLVVSLIVVIALMILITLGSAQIAQVVRNDEIRPWLFLLPVSVFLTAIFTILNYLNGRAKQFQEIAKANVWKSIAASILQLGAGILKAGPAGLILGYVSSLLAANGRLFRNATRGQRYSEIVSREQMLVVAKKHAQLPKYTLWAGLLNSAAMNGIGILIATYYLASTLGFYALVQRVLGAPITLIGTAAGQVFFQRASAISNSDPRGAYLLFRRTSRALMLLSAVIFVPLYFVIEPLFAVLFGQDWRVAGRYAQLLIPLFAVRFVVSPLSVMNQVNRHNKAGMLVNFLLFAAMVAIVVSSGVSGLEPSAMFSALTLSQGAIYIGFFFYIEHTARTIYLKCAES